MGLSPFRTRNWDRFSSHGWHVGTEGPEGTHGRELPLAHRKKIEPELGAIPLTKLTQRDLNEFMGRKLEAGLSARRSYIAMLLFGALSRGAEKDGLVGRNVAKLAEAPGGVTATAYRAAHACGGNAVPLCRRWRRPGGPVLGCPSDRITPWGITCTGVARRYTSAGTVTVRANLQRIRRAAPVEGEKKSRLVLSDDTKGKKSRLIPLPKFAIEALQRHKENQEHEPQFAGDAWKDSGLVFTTKVETPIEPRNAVATSTRC